MIWHRSRGKPPLWSERRGIAMRHCEFGVLGDDKREHTPRPRRWMTGYREVETGGRGGATMIWPGETEAGSARRNPAQG
jgi:hypothetical protein